ncbi:MAG TPA: hypothetical protein VK508_03665 [Cyclobacteriaceae bacterium]|nr:hypothetical protein [Cyclobacteriaceae bacterium]
MSSVKRSFWNYLASDSGYKVIGDRMFKAFGYFGRLANSIQYYRQEVEDKKKSAQNPAEYQVDEKAISRITKDMVVMHGPFKGMKYPQLSRLSGYYIRGPILAKMVGCYEREVHGFLEDILKKEYTEILNIGSAEGYYSVGFARIFPNSRNVAFDIDVNARDMCKQIAALNGVEARIEVDSRCTSETLINFRFRKRGLILSDCEGFEKDLFTPEVVRKVSNCDLLIELHDFADPNIYPVLHQLFKDTHTERLVSSWNDAQKIRNFDYPELQDLNPQTIKHIVDEHRPHQEWMFLESKAIVR